MMFLHGKVAVIMAEPFEPESYTRLRTYETRGRTLLAVQEDYGKREKHDHFQKEVQEITSNIPLTLYKMEMSIKPRFR